MGKEVSK